MDYQKIADSFISPACILSVEKKDDGYGEIRFVTGNALFADMINGLLQKRNPDLLTGDGSAFAPGTLYTDFIPHNRNFEEVAAQTALDKIEIHTGAHIGEGGIWLDIYSMPLICEDETHGYCIQILSPGEAGDTIPNKYISSQTSNDVLNACIKLHKADNLKDAIGNVIYEIRRICKSAGCTVLLINREAQDYSILATDYNPDPNIKRVTEFKDFYSIASSWEKMLETEGECVIIKDEKDMDYFSKVNHPWYLTLVEAHVNTVVLFPLRQGNELLGFIWVTNFNGEDALRIKETLELTTFFISSHIARYKVIQRLQHMSYTETLTGLPNRFASRERISKLIENGETFTAVAIDLNNFKSINDTLGFDAGNQVLVEIAKRWDALSEGAPEQSDCFLSRTSGDEFVLLIRNYKNQEDFLNTIDKYVNALRENLTVDGCDLHVSASFGYAEYPTDADSADSLLSHANAAMKEIKKANSSQHVLRFTSDILRDEHILEIENMIRNAIEKDTIFFNLQPQYDMDHKLRGFEALARMRDANGNVISPGEFIPVAEKVGLIDRVDGIVFKKAGRFFGDLLKRTGADLTLSINASVRHLMKNDFLSEIRELILTSDIPASKLEIEITESIMIDSAEKALRCIDEIKSMGIQIAIDDFGTGYSSLSYLNRFPANLLKIDKSFIDKMDSSESSRQYVASIISIGHILGFDVISEGVEDPDQLRTLKEIGCDFIQGFIWGHPMSAEDSERLVLEEMNK
jgi:diguanylate cyclase (GGDEF)-like protein